MNRLDRITIDPKVMGGKACVRGMRVTVGNVVGLLASGALPCRDPGGLPIFGARRYWPIFGLCSLEAGGTRSSTFGAVSLKLLLE